MLSEITQQGHPQPSSSRRNQHQSHRAGLQRESDRRVRARLDSNQAVQRRGWRRSIRNRLNRYQIV